MISCTSPPEQKLSPAPAITTACTSVAYLSWPNRSRSSAYESKVSGFLRSGRFSVMVATRVFHLPEKMTGLVAGQRFAVARGQRRVQALGLLVHQWSPAMG